MQAEAHTCVFICVSSFISPVSSLVMNHHVEVCPLSRGIAIPMHPVNRCPLLFPQSFADISIDFPCGRLAVGDLHTGKYRFTVFRINNMTGGLDSISYAGRFLVRVSPFKGKDNLLRTFWFKPVSAFGLFARNDTYDSSLLLIMPPSLASRLNALSDYGFVSRLILTLQRITLSRQL